MSADGLARFAISDEGKLYARVCSLYGVDPAAPVQGFDELLAYDFRMALLLTREEPEEPMTHDGPGIVTDLDKQIEAMLR